MLPMISPPLKLITLTEHGFSKGTDAGLFDKYLKATYGFHFFLNLLLAQLMYFRPYLLVKGSCSIGVQPNTMNITALEIQQHQLPSRWLCLITHLLA